MNKQDIVSRVLIFIAMLIIIALAYPHKSGSFSYHFEEGRPWNHGLITAQYDFPVYKSEEQIKQEKAEALSKFAPYFTLNSRIAREQTAAAENAAKGVLTKQESAYLKQTLQRVYAVGILSIEDAGMVQKQGFSRITVVNSKHQGEAYPLNDCFTPRGAYELLLAGSPEGEHTKLPLIGLNGLLLPNLTFDSTTTAIMHQKLLNEITEIEISGAAVDLSKITATMTTTVDLNTYLPEGVKVADSNDAQATIKINLSGEETKSFHVSTANLTIRNLADGKTVSFDSMTVDVKISGNANQLASLSAATITGYIDVSGLDTGRHTVPVNLELEDGLSAASVTAVITIM